MHMHRASHALSKIQYVHASNLGILMFGALKKLFIHYEHGTKANIGGAKMANNRNAVNRNFLQSYWTSDRLSLYQ
jgi:hypothetical protein